MILLVLLLRMELLSALPGCRLCRMGPERRAGWHNNRYVGSVLTVGGNDSDAIMDQLNNGGTPAGIRIVDYKSAGIDPYQLLSR